MRISDWSSDVCSSDLRPRLRVDQESLLGLGLDGRRGRGRRRREHRDSEAEEKEAACEAFHRTNLSAMPVCDTPGRSTHRGSRGRAGQSIQSTTPRASLKPLPSSISRTWSARSEEHTSELPSLMRTPYAVF